MAAEGDNVENAGENVEEVKFADTFDLDDLVSSGVNEELEGIRAKFIYFFSLPFWYGKLWVQWGHECLHAWGGILYACFGLVAMFISIAFGGPLFTAYGFVGIAHHVCVALLAGVSALAVSPLVLACTGLAGIVVGFFKYCGLFYTGSVKRRLIRVRAIYRSTKGKPWYVRGWETSKAGFWGFWRELLFLGLLVATVYAVLKTYYRKRQAAMRRQARTRDPGIIDVVARVATASTAVSFLFALAYTDWREAFALLSSLTYAFKFFMDNVLGDSPKKRQERVNKKEGEHGIEFVAPAGDKPDAEFTITHCSDCTLRPFQVRVKRIHLDDLAVVLRQNRCPRCSTDMKDDTSNVVGNCFSDLMVHSQKCPLVPLPPTPCQRCWFHGYVRAYHHFWDEIPDWATQYASDNNLDMPDLDNSEKAAGVLEEASTTAGDEPSWWQRVKKFWEKFRWHLLFVAAAMVIVATIGVLIYRWYVWWDDKKNKNLSVPTPERPKQAVQHIPRTDSFDSSSDSVSVDASINVNTGSTTPVIAPTVTGTTIPTEQPKRDCLSCSCQSEVPDFTNRMIDWNTVPAVSEAVKRAASVNWDGIPIIKHGRNRLGLKQSNESGEEPVTLTKVDPVDPPEAKVPRASDVSPPGAGSKKKKKKLKGKDWGTSGDDGSDGFNKEKVSDEATKVVKDALKKRHCPNGLNCTYTSKKHWRTYAHVEEPNKSQMALASSMATEAVNHGLLQFVVRTHDADTIVGSGFQAHSTVNTAGHVLLMGRPTHVCWFAGSKPSWRGQANQSKFGTEPAVSVPLQSFGVLVLDMDPQSDKAILLPPAEFSQAIAEAQKKTGIKFVTYKIATPVQNENAAVWGFHSTQHKIMVASGPLIEVKEKRIHGAVSTDWGVSGGPWLNSDGNVIATHWGVGEEHVYNVGTRFSVKEVEGMKSPPPTIASKALKAGFTSAIVNYLDPN